MGSLEHFVYARMQFSHTYKSLYGTSVSSFQRRWSQHGCDSCRGSEPANRCASNCCAHSFGPMHQPLHALLVVNEVTERMTRGKRFDL